MRTHHKEKLKQEFVGVRIVGCDRVGEMPEAVLSADLAELAGPVGEDSGKTGVRQICICCVAAAVKAAADGPAAVGAVFGVGIEAKACSVWKTVAGETWLRALQKNSLRNKKE